MPLLPEGGKTAYALPNNQPAASTGAMAEMYQQNKKLNLVVDVVADLGASADGTSDVTAMVQDASDVAGDGGVVLFRTGTYVIAANSVVVSSTGQTWRLEPGATLLLKAGSTRQRLVSVTGPDFTLAGRGTIDGNESNLGTLTSDGDSLISFSSTAHRGKVTAGVNITGSRMYGIRADNADDITVEDSNFSDIWWTGLFVIASTRTIKGPVVRNNNFNFADCPVNTTGFGSATVLASGMSIISNNNSYRVSGARITDNRVACPPAATVSLSDTSACIGVVRADNASVKGNELAGSAIGITMVQCSNVTITGNPGVSNFKLFGIEFAGCISWGCTGNTVDGNGYGTAGIISDSSSGGSSDGTITGNTVRNLTATAATACVTISSGSSDITINGNILTAANRNTARCVTVNGPDGIAILGNRMKGNGTPTFAMDMIGSSTTAILGNVVSGFASGPVIVSGTTDHVRVIGNTYSSAGSVFVTGTISGSDKQVQLNDAP